MNERKDLPVSGDRDDQSLLARDRLPECQYGEQLHTVFCNGSGLDTPGCPSSPPAAGPGGSVEHKTEHEGIVQDLCQVCGRFLAGSACAKRRGSVFREKASKLSWR